MRRSKERSSLRKGGECPGKKRLSLIIMETDTMKRRRRNKDRYNKG